MSKIFNAQNLANSKWEGREYLIYFTSSDGSYDIYRYVRSTGAVKIAPKASELLKAKTIYVSYSYLGGIHLSNYKCTKTNNGDQTLFTFTLQKVTSTLRNNLQYWDVPNAAFIDRDMVAPHNRGLEPIRSFTITFTGDTLINTSFTTFGDGTKTHYNKNWATAYGPWTHEVQGETETEDLVAIMDLSTEQVTMRQHTAMNFLEQDARNSGNPLYFSFLGGDFFDDTVHFYSDFTLIAGFYCFEQTGGQLFYNLYMVISSDHSFDIYATPDLEAYAAKIQLVPGTADLDFSGWTVQPFEYFNIDNH